MSLPHSVPCRGRTGGPGALAVWSRHSSSGGLRRAQRSTRRQPSRRRRGTPESNRDVDKAAAALPQWLDPVDRAEPRAAARLQRHAEQRQLTSTTWPRTEDPKSARAPRAGPVQADGHFMPAAQHRSAPHAPPRTGKAGAHHVATPNLSPQTQVTQSKRGEWDSGRLVLGIPTAAVGILYRGIPEFLAYRPRHSPRRPSRIQMLGRGSPAAVFVD